MKKFLIVLVASLFFLTWQGQQKAAASGDKVTICHNTGNGDHHSITVSINAVPAHLANHGDSIGDCDEGGGGQE